MPSSGTMKINRIQPALPQPDRSLRRKMSAKIAMNIQMSMKMKKNSIITHSTEPKLHSVASTPRSFPSPVGRPIRYRAAPERKDSPGWAGGANTPGRNRYPASSAATGEHTRHGTFLEGGTYDVPSAATHGLGVHRRRDR